MSPAEMNYLQIEKEALSLIYGVTQFHQYLYGHLCSYRSPSPDHLLGPKQVISPLAATRMQCWSLVLSEYNYSIEFCPTTAHANADGLSQLLLETHHSTSMNYTYALGQIQALPVTAERIGTATRQDNVKVCKGRMPT